MRFSPRDIKNKALKIKEQTPNLKLTQIQHNLVKDLGFTSFQAFLATYEKAYKTDNLAIIREIKTLVFDNYKHILHSFNKLSSVNKRSEKLWTTYMDTDNSNDERTYEDFQEQVFQVIDKIKSLSIPNYFFVEHLPSIAQSDPILVFAIYNDEWKMNSGFEGRNADYTFILDSEYHKFELYEKDDFDGFYFDFPQI